MTCPASPRFPVSIKTFCTILHWQYHYGCPLDCVCSKSMTLLSVQYWAEFTMVTAVGSQLWTHCPSSSHCRGRSDSWLTAALLHNPAVASPGQVSGWAAALWPAATPTLPMHTAHNCAPNLATSTLFMSLIIQIGTMNMSIDNLVFDFDTFQYTCTCFNFQQKKISFALPENESYKGWSTCYWYMSRAEHSRGQCVGRCLWVLSSCVHCNIKQAQPTPHRALGLDTGCLHRTRRRKAADLVRITHNTSEKTLSVCWHPANRPRTLPLLEEKPHCWVTEERISWYDCTEADLLSVLVALPFVLASANLLFSLKMMKSEVLLLTVFLFCLNLELGLWHLTCPQPHLLPHLTMSVYYTFKIQ